MPDISSTNVYGSMIYFFPCSPLWKLSMASVNVRVVSTFMATKSPKMWRARIWSAEDWGKKRKKKERKETDKSRKIVQFPRERKTSSITLLAWCSLTQLLTLNFLLIILVSSGKISFKILLKGPDFYNQHRKLILIHRLSTYSTTF